jgi:hypothetical protein
LSSSSHERYMTLPRVVDVTLHPRCAPHILPSLSSAPQTLAINPSKIAREKPDHHHVSSSSPAHFRPPLHEPKSPREAPRRPRLPPRRNRAESTQNIAMVVVPFLRTPPFIYNSGGPGPLRLWQLHHHVTGKLVHRMVLSTLPCFMASFFRRWPLLLTQVPQCMRASGGPLLLALPAFGSRRRAVHNATSRTSCFNRNRRELLRRPPATVSHGCHASATSTTACPTCLWPWLDFPPVRKPAQILI